MIKDGLFCLSASVGVLHFGYNPENVWPFDEGYPVCMKIYVKSDEFHDFF